MKWPENLTGKQVRVLRGLGHHLSPKVMIGRQGITDQIIASAEAVLVTDELIKIKIASSSEVDRQQAAVVIAERTKSSIVQVLGKTILLYRENKEKKAAKKIQLP
jgi:RNA-binding protein